MSKLVVMNVPFAGTRELQDVAVDGMCACGHLERDHASSCLNADGKIVRLAHAGNCCKGKCACRQFRWVRYVSAAEYANNHCEESLTNCCS